MFRFLSSLLGKSHNVLEERDPMKKFLVVGLGNIGSEYTHTRHNIGFKIVDALAEKEDSSFATEKLGDIATVKIKGKSVLLLKPSTFMNRSGKAIKYWMEKEKISLENTLVITDDINLPFGTLRVKTKGSDGGHNGLKDTQNTLQTSAYNRFRFGVGAEFSKGRQVDYVLGEWNEKEKQALPERLRQSTEIIRSFVFSGVTNTMNRFNGT
ncbi:MAG: aminoacyl-tRNA hydrolase [Bacteroidota bacterium]